MFPCPEKKLHQRIETIWKQGDTWPDFIDTMRQALEPDQADDERNKIGLSQWMQLPGLCCQAAGGDPHWADDLAAAWILFYSAARIMDHVEDHDLPDPWWVKIGPGAAINAASGLYFTASRMLNRLYVNEETSRIAGEVVDDVYSSFLKMCSGQHRDLVQSKPALDQCWEIATAKSGTFFSLACRAGARLATEDNTVIKSFNQFGCHMGVLVQILDDLEEIQILKKGAISEPAPDYGRSLAVVFTLEVFPPKTSERLRKCLQSAARDSEASREAYRLIEQSGAGLYLTTQLERHQSLALTALERAARISPAREVLADLIDQLVSN